MQSLVLGISQSNDLASEGDKAYLFERIYLPDLIDLRFHSRQDTLFAGNKSLALVLQTWQVIQLRLVSWLHELSQRLDLFLTDAVFQFHFSLDNASRVHTS